MLDCHLVHLMEWQMGEMMVDGKETYSELQRQKVVHSWLVPHLVQQKVNQRDQYLVQYLVEHLVEQTWLGQNWR